MEDWLSLSFPLRAAIVFALGCIVGNAVNWAIMRWRMDPLGSHPWTTRPISRRWYHYLPIIGWLTRGNEQSLWGRGFERRPLLIEFAHGLLWAGLYWYACQEFSLLSSDLQNFLLHNPRVPPATLLAAQTDMHLLVVIWCGLSSLMVIATFIDLDEQIIPDIITVPGTLAGLTLMTLLPNARMPWSEQIPGAAPVWSSTSLASPNSWPTELNCGEWYGYLLGAGCFSLWGIGLLPRVWYGRFGFARAWRYFWAIIAREGAYRWIVPIILLGNLAIYMVWSGGNVLAWQSLLSALVGMAAGGLIIWAVRIVGQLALGREAMGFGDVTLMAMIGAVIGWQAIPAIFFVAPFAGALLGVVRWVMRGENMLPYGPFLCLGTWLVWFGWDNVRSSLEPTLSIPWLIPGVLGVCFVLLGLMLTIIRRVRGY